MSFLDNPETADMNTGTIAPMRSLRAQALQDLFDALRTPYGDRDVIRFNLALRRAHPHLSEAERRHGEQLLEAVIAGSKERSASRGRAGAGTAASRTETA